MREGRGCLSSRPRRAGDIRIQPPHSAWAWAQSCQERQGLRRKVDPAMPSQSVHPGAEGQPPTYTNAQDDSAYVG